MYDEDRIEGSDDFFFNRAQIDSHFMASKSTVEFCAQTPPHRNASVMAETDEVPQTWVNTIAFAKVPANTQTHCKQKDDSPREKQTAVTAWAP